MQGKSAGGTVEAAWTVDSRAQPCSCCGLGGVQVQCADAPEIDISVRLGEGFVELLHERCAGLDIGKKDLKACVRTPTRVAAGRVAVM